MGIAHRETGCVVKTKLPHAMILEHSRFATEVDRTELVSVDRKVEE